MRIILDTNVIIASFATRGLCYGVFELCLDRYEAVISSFLIDEIKAALLKKIRVPEVLIKEIVEFLSKNTTSFEVKHFSQNICRDPDDARVLALAEISHAEFIITGDEDLLTLKKYGSTRIVTPRQFWELSRKQK